MKLASGFIAFALLPLFSTGCQHRVSPPVSNSRPAPPAPVSLIGTWKVVSVNGLSIRPNAVTVTFIGTGQFQAMIDCNNARGSFIFNGADLSFVGWNETERGCASELQHEALIGDALRGDRYAVAFTSGSELHLLGPYKVILRRAR